jgi:hypothetical protein
MNYEARDALRDVIIQTYLELPTEFRARADT